MSVACSKDDEGISEPATIPVSSIKLNLTSVTLNVGESVELTAIVSPANATNKTVTWASTNTSVATVTDGKVIAKAIGTATIKAQCGNIKAECLITVKATEVISVKLDPASAELYEDETIQLTATVTPEDTSDPITWKSSDEEIATVSEGKVYARRAGTATITASVGSGENAKTATCPVTVKCRVNGVSLKDHSLTVKQGETKQLSATVYPDRASNKAVRWSSDAPHIASVSETGLLTANASGTATITVTTTEGGFKDDCVVTVISNVDGITLDKNELALRVKETYQLKATVSPAGATNKNVTWTSSDSTVATVDDNGKVTAVAIGKAIICVTTKDGGSHAFCSVKVRSRVDEITLSPEEMTLLTTDTDASKCTLTANITPADANVTLRWESTNGAVATVKASGKTCEVIPVGSGKTTIRVSAPDGDVATASVTVKQPYTKIVLDKPQLSLEEGATGKLTATLTPQTTPDDFIVWSSDPTGIATVDNNGNVKAIKVGTATITVASKLKPDVKATCTVTVTRSVIPVTGVSVSPTTLTLNMGEKRTITAKIEPANVTNKEVKWTTSDSTVATVDNTGTVTAMSKEGTATITATSVGNPNKSATCTVKVVRRFVPVTGLTVSPSSLRIYLGQKKQLTAKVLPDDATDKSVAWSIQQGSSGGVAVDQNGVVTALRVGTARVFVKTNDGGFSESVQVTITKNDVESIELPNNISDNKIALKVGETYDLTVTVKGKDPSAPASDPNVMWKSSDQTIATVASFANGNDASKKTGRITARKAGSATITVVSADNPNRYATCTVTVTNSVIPVTGVSVNPTELTLYKGESKTITATITPSNAENQNVAWRSSNGSIATVDANGTVVARNTGTATITVTTEDGGHKASCNVTVKEKSVNVTSITLNKSSLTLNFGGSETITATIKPDNATNKKVDWTSSDPTVATVDNNGKITAMSKEGTATITATSVGNPSLSAICRVTVTSPVIHVKKVSVSPTTLSMYPGESKALTATIDPSNAENKNVSWTSSKGEVATVNANGTVVARSVGTATITVTTEDGSKTATCAVTVKEKPVNVTSITLDKSSFTLSFGDSETINATIKPDNATNKKVVWSSSDTTVAKVDNNGKVTAMSKEGTVTITATSEDNPSLSATCTVTVTRPVIPVTSIALNKTSATLSAGETVQLTATISPDNATNKTVTWSSSNTSVATVTNGKVTAKAAGSATITARTNNGLSATCSITVVKDGDVPPGGSEGTGEEEWK